MSVSHKVAERGPLETLIHEFDKLAEQHAEYPSDSDERRNTHDVLQKNADTISEFWSKIGPDLRLQGMPHGELQAFDTDLEQWLQDRFWVAINSPIPQKSKAGEGEPPVYA
jgi:hypothetical protein